MYNADIGRFISADTIVPVAGNPQALNRYAYAANNPIRYSDPTGHRYEDGWTPNTTIGGGTGGDPILEAFAVVGQEQPFAYPRWMICEACRHANLRWSDMTKAASETLFEAGWNLNLLPWSPTQRGIVAGWIGGYSVKTGIDAPSLGEIVDYLGNGAPVPVILAAGGAGGGIRANWEQHRRLEQASRLPGEEPPSRIGSESGAKKWRVTDGSTPRHLLERKSGTFVGTTTDMVQFGDEMAAARTIDKRLMLIVSVHGTTYSGELSRLIRSGAIDLLEVEFTR